MEDESTYIFAREHFVKRAIFNCRLCFHSNRFVKHADLTRSYKDRQNEPFHFHSSHTSEGIITCKVLGGRGNFICPKI